MDETFTLLPLQIDPSSKALSAPSLPSLSSHLATLNTLHRTLLSLPAENHATPPAPLPTNPKRSAQIAKMRDQANSLLRKSSPASAHEAVKLYTYAIEMALGRPGWEPAGMVREEAGLLFANRSQAYMAVQMWPEGASDAENSIGLKRVGNGKAWWRRGRCLVEMGRWEEARTWVREGVEVEGGGEGAGELASLGREIEAEMGKRGMLVQ